MDCKSPLRALAAAALLAGLAACADAPLAPAATSAEEKPADASLAVFGDAFLTVSGGNAFTCGTTLDGAAWCWGINDNGELGTGDFAGRTTPARVQGVSAAVQASAGADHACAVTVTGRVFCWGSNFYGQLGNGSTADSPAPVRAQAPAGVRFVAVSAAVAHTCALALDGSAWCWGDNSLGELGDGTFASSTTPVRVAAPAGVRFTSVATGDGSVHSCGVDTQGGAWCWGDNTFGQLGTGAAGGPEGAPVAVRRPAGVRFAGVSGTGFAHTCALSSALEGWCWGDNGTGQLGTGDGVSSAAPVRVATDRRFASLTPGWFHSCGATLASGALCWGDNNTGKLGNGTQGGFSFSPVAVVSSQGFGRMDPGSDHSCSRARDGRAFCWGRGGFGELGNGSPANSPVPVQVTPPSQSTTLAPSLNRSVVPAGEVRSGRERWCAARPDAGRLAVCS